METLSNFTSIYCSISFVIGVLFMLAILSISDVRKVKDTKNKVRFFVERVISDNYFLYIKGKDRYYPFVSERLFKNFGLNIDDFADMKDGEIREVFIDLKD